MERIAVLIGEDFEDSEYSEPAKAFKNAGHQLEHIGLEKGKTVKGKRSATPVGIERSVADVSVNDYDALFIPGGYSPDHLRVDSNAVRFAGDFVKSGKPVFVICHGPQLLITARVLSGRRVAGWKSIAQDVINAGAEFVDQEVVEDGNIISSRSPADIPAFVNVALQRLQSLRRAA
ncbi:MAG TPA: type 1 glutamine amidotransferase domain-containing protein [Chitinispirillaceae bacterium]|nr:type 1 glutamine amidotransferase domain-containing protein [Chitinispirillaceae bacterium]